MKKLSLRISMLGLTALAGSNSAFAQAAPPRLSIPDAAAVLAPAPLPPPAMKAAHPLLAPQLDLPAPAAGKLHFNSVRIVGATRLPAAKIAALFVPLEGKQITADALKPVLDAVNALYVDAGLPLGRAFVPAQHLKGGELTIAVVEGYVEKLSVQADNADDKALVEYMAAPILAERPLTRATMERVVLLLQDLPGITLGTKFTDMDPRTGGVTLAISASIKTATVGFSLDNRTNLGTLPVLPYAIVTLNNLFGGGDQIVLTTLLSPRQKDDAYYGLSATQPIGNDGLRAGFDAAWAQTLDDVTLRPYEVRGRNTQLGTSVKYPVWKATDETLTAQARLYYTRAAYGLAGLSGVLANDEYMAVDLGADYARSFSSDLGLSTNLHLTQGLTSLTGEPHTRLNTIPGFTKVRAQATLAWRAMENTTLNFSTTGQYSPDSLVSSEEIAFGGLAYGRAFSPSEIAGDSGVGFSFKPEYLITLTDQWSLTPFLTGDYAKSYSRSSDLRSDGELISTGGGVKIGLTGFGDVSLEMDKPLNRTPLDRNSRGWRFFAGAELSLDKVTGAIGQSL